MITAQVVADSYSSQGARLTTVLVTYPRFVHAEHMRHRVFSYNVSSSRAIPMKRFAQQVSASPVEPVWWGMNQPGMKARQELSGVRLWLAKRLWHLARHQALAFHTLFRWVGLHKQVANRIIEPWMEVAVLFTGTEWKNFFMLRCHKDAQPEFQAMADAVLHAYLHSLPKFVPDGGWHLPFCDRGVDPAWSVEALKKVSVARCARLSYATFDTQSSVLGKSSVDRLAKDSALHDELSKSGHWSPFEQQATPDAENGQRFHGNVKGWVQYRKSFPSENWEDQDIGLWGLLAERLRNGSIYARGSQDR